MNNPVYPRIQSLKQWSLSVPREVDTSRAVLLTQAYQSHANLPPILRRAHAFSRVLENIPIFLENEQLLAGNIAGKPMAASLYPEYSFDWLIEEMKDLPGRPGDRFLVSEQAQDEIKQLADWWQGKKLIDRCSATLPDDIKQCYQSGVLSATGNMTSGDGHTLVDFPAVLREGLAGVMARARKKLESLDGTEADHARAEIFLQAVLIVCQAVVRYAHRHAHLAETLAAEEMDPLRKKELLALAKACRRVPEFPAGSFYEAVQSTWFIHLLIHMESNGHSWSFGRFDQYMQSYLEKDLETGEITVERAGELLCCLWLKTYSIPKIRPWVHTLFSAGNPTYQNVTIGGMRPDGMDGTNLMTYLVLDSVAQTRLPQPNLSARWHAGSPPEYLQRCFEVIKLGFGMPALHNDDLMVPSLRMRGVTEEDARNYAIVGCIEPIVPGKWGYRAAGMSFTNFAKILELTLHGGFDPITQVQVGCRTRPFAEMQSWEDLWASWKEQLQFIVRQRVRGDTVIDLAIEELVPDAFCSALVEDCIGRGKHLKEGGAIYDMVCGPETGLADTANSLAAVKKLVFDQKAISAEQLLELLAGNYAGADGERLRQILLTRAPKYGNDIEEVDQIASDVFSSYIHELDQYHNTRYQRGPIGCGYFPCTATISANVPLGARVGALPSGRRSREPMAEGISPSQGTDRCGPTAVLKSVARLPNIQVTGGNLLNQRLSPSVMATPEGMWRVINLVRGFFQLGGWHIQFNVISSDVLRAAQKEPHKFSDLVVRVAGYSARFVDLAPAVQEDIIARTEHLM